MAGSKPLANDFPLLSHGSRPSADVYLLKRIAEVKRELDQRRRFYPNWVAQGRITALEMEHEIRIFEAIEHDLMAAHRQEETGVWAMPGAGDGPLDPAAVREAWEAKVRALRRELALRRNAYRKRVEQGRLSQADADKQLERLEAVHWMYWVEGFCLAPPVDGAWDPAHPDYRGEAAEAHRATIRAHAARLEAQQAEAA